MTATRGRIENLVTRIQDDFLRTPWLALTPATARERFGVDEITCEAVLNALADSHVVSRSRQGIYVRDFPQAARRNIAKPLRARQQAGPQHTGQAA
jgi:hypothetical protein